MKVVALVSAIAVVSFAGCADPAKQPVSHWVEMLRSGDSDDRAEAREWLSKKGKEAVPEVARLLSDDDLVVAMSASDVLAAIGRDAVPALIEVVRIGSTRARGWAAHALGAIGKDATEAVPALQEARKDPAVRAAASEALLKIQ